MELDYRTVGYGVAGSRVRCPNRIGGRNSPPDTGRTVQISVNIPPPKLGGVAARIKDSQDCAQTGRSVQASV